MILPSHPLTPDGASPLFCNRVNGRGRDLQWRRARECRLGWQASKTADGQKWHDRDRPPNQQTTEKKDDRRPDRQLALAPPLPRRQHYVMATTRACSCPRSQCCGRFRKSTHIVMVRAVFVFSAVRLDGVERGRALLECMGKNVERQQADTKPAAGHIRLVSWVAAGSPIQARKSSSVSPTRA